MRFFFFTVFNCILYLNPEVRPVLLVPYHEIFHGFVTTDVLNTSLVPSGFVQEEPEDQADLCTSDFPHANSAVNQTRRQTGQIRGQDHSGSLRSVGATIATQILSYVSSL